MAKRPQLTFEELCQLKWLSGGVMTLLSFLTLYYMEAGIVLVIFFGTLLVSTAVLFPRLPGVFPPLFWKLLTPILILFIVGDFFVSRPDFVGPLVRMVALLAIVRAVSYRSNREDTQLVLLSLFMIVVAGVLTLEFTFAFQLLLFMPVAMGNLYLINLIGTRTRKETPGNELWDRFRWGHFFARLRYCWDHRMVVVGAGLFVFVLAISAIIFFSMPRFRLDQALPFLQMPSSQSLSGFSDNIEFGDVVDIIEDNRVALRVDLPPGIDPPGTPYWRMVVLDEYYSGGFRKSTSAKRMARDFTDNHFRLPSTGEPDPESTWVFYLEGGITSFLPIPGPFEGLRFQTRKEVKMNQALSTWATREISSNVLIYQLEDLRNTIEIPTSRFDEALPDAGPLAVTIEGRVDASPLSYPQTTLGVPAGAANQEILRRIVQEITQGEEMGALEFSQRAKAWLENRHGYALSTRIPGGQADALVRWLDSGQPGHCELFAGAFTLLARTAGHPTRVVTGYLGGDWNGYENYYMVRNRHAHAWVEVFSGRGHWFRVDPTPGSGPIDQQQSGGLFTDLTLGAYFDSLRVLWYRRIVNFDDKQQEEMVSGIKDISEGLMAGLRARLTAWGEWWQGLLQNPFQGDRWLDLGRNLVIVLLAWVAFRILMKGFGQMRSGRRRLDPIRRRAGLWLESLREDELPGPQLTAKTLATGRALILDLRTIRFGDPEDWPDSESTFRHLKQWRRLARREGKKAN